MEKNKLKILLVEDEVLVAFQMKRELEAFGYFVYEPAYTGQAAIDSAREETPDICIMDIRLPGDMDGIDAAQIIQSENDVPVIFVTGYKDSEIVERAQGVKPLAVLGKPTLIKQIEEVIEKAFN
ncbi:MAG: response regulator [Spirochaetales bacterium]|nr:response regulator [Spirochaetales bacterium]